MLAVKALGYNVTELSPRNDCLGDFPLPNGVGFRHNLVLTQSVKLRGMTHPELRQEAKVR